VAGGVAPVAVAGGAADGADADGIEVAAHQAADLERAVVGERAGALPVALCPLGGHDGIVHCSCSPGRRPGLQARRTLLSVGRLSHLRRASQLGAPDTKVSATRLRSGKGRRKGGAAQQRA